MNSLNIHIHFKLGILLRSANERAPVSSRDVLEAGTSSFRKRCVFCLSRAVNSIRMALERQTSCPVSQRSAFLPAHLCCVVHGVSFLSSRWVVNTSLPGRHSYRGNKQGPLTRSTGVLTQRIVIITNNCRTL